MSLDQEKKLAQYVLSVTRQEILKHYQKDVVVDFKKDESPVTIADKNSEELVRKILEKETPDYPVIGEEFGGVASGKGREWVVDPIDGTKSFIHNTPLFGTLLALLENGKPILGYMDFPALDIQIWAASQEGCWIGEKQCSVSSTKKISESTLLDGNVVRVMKEKYFESWSELIQKARVYRGWGDCYGYYLVAIGKAEVMLDPVVNLWDVAPVGIILKEAGGKFTSIEGEETIHQPTGLGTNGYLHDEIVSAVN